ncbi:MAG: alkaline phosphatase D family protein [Actinobacteria bacterium]|nr:alkaline phosphatase D family protein [Actinomycetota bacterium]
MLRYVDETCATIWVETDAACDVEVLGSRASTFHVEGHHYALVVVEGLEPGSTNPYGVHLDGERAWPPEEGGEFPDPAIRTRRPDGRFRLAFGSCRTAAPHEPPWTLPVAEDAQGRGSDALLAYALRMRDQDPEAWPDALLLLGDQVYADDASPETREFIRSRRDTSEPPGEEVADLEEYTRLYREAWSESWIRWLLSTVPVAMIFDDHDIIDDWNISRSWLEDARAEDWWDERIVSGLVAYWLYQHLGNLSPQGLDEDDLYRRVREADDAGPVLREMAQEADRDSSTFRWSYARSYGPVRLVVVDSRAGRVLTDGHRDMLDEDEWEWIAGEMARDCDHLLIATSLPYVLARGIHGLEAWNEAICDGAWGPLGARAGEAIRRAIDLEHWPAFRGSFERLTAMIRAVGSGTYGAPPSSIVVLSGDVHHAYLAQLYWRKADEVVSHVFQAVASPMRNAVEPVLRRVYRFALSRVGEAIGRGLERAAGVPEPSVRWRFLDGPIFRNQVSVVETDGRRARLVIEGVTGEHRGPGQRPELEPLVDRPLTPPS